ncbi:hypothetical protein GCM10019059_42560 [Camelimonas fluminis]|nr:hypothetical protein GCM10019059_42560 [Camelimonas fluminis]
MATLAAGGVETSSLACLSDHSAGRLFFSQKIAAVVSGGYFRTYGMATCRPSAAAEILTAGWLYPTARR